MHTTHTDYTTKKHTHGHPSSFFLFHLAGRGLPRAEADDGEFVARALEGQGRDLGCTLIEEKGSSLTSNSVRWTLVWSSSHYKDCGLVDGSGGWGGRLAGVLVGRVDQLI